MFFQLFNFANSPSLKLVLLLVSSLKLLLVSKCLNFNVPWINHLSLLPWFLSLVILHVCCHPIKRHILLHHITFAHLLHQLPSFVTSIKHLLLTHSAFILVYFLVSTCCLKRHRVNWVNWSFFVPDTTLSKVHERCSIS